MNVQSSAKLLGVRPTKGTMKDSDTGDAIVWDQIEIHTLSALDEARGGVGHTVQIHKIKGTGMAESALAENLKRAVGKDINMTFSMTSDGKGGNLKMVLQNVEIPPAK
ncbi:MAG: hypothetical protein V7739_17790 [Motiliproteus sp.]